MNRKLHGTTRKRWPADHANFLADDLRALNSPASWAGLYRGSAGVQGQPIFWYQSKQPPNFLGEPIIWYDYHWIQSKQAPKFLETVRPATLLLTWLGDKRPPFCQATDRARGNPKTKLGADQGGGVSEAVGSPREGDAQENSRMRREGQRVRACERAEDGGVCDQGRGGAIHC
jgi:hypothetical protein